MSLVLKRLVDQMLPNAKIALLLLGMPQAHSWKPKKKKTWTNSQTLKTCNSQTFRNPYAET